MPNESMSSVSSVGVRLRQTLRGHNDVITRLAWSPDGSTLASAPKDGTVRLWDLETGELRRVFDCDSASVYSVAWSPDGRLLASVSQDGTIRWWSTETGEPCGTGNLSARDQSAWSPDWQTLAIGAYGGVLFWDLKTGERRSSSLSRVVVGSDVIVSSTPWTLIWS